MDKIFITYIKMSNAREIIKEIERQEELKIERVKELKNLEIEKLKELKDLKRISRRENLERKEIEEQEIEKEKIANLANKSSIIPKETLLPHQNGGNIQRCNNKKQLQMKKLIHMKNDQDLNTRSLCINHFL